MGTGHAAITYGVEEIENPNGKSLVHVGQNYDV